MTAIRNYGAIGLFVAGLAITPLLPYFDLGIKLMGCMGADSGQC